MSFTYFVVYSFLILYLSSNAQALGTENIVGGKLARILYYPYHAYVRNSKDMCNGAIVSEWHIITAAHCLTNENGQIVEKTVKVSVGASNFKVASIFRFDTQAKVAFIHKDFDPRNKSSKCTDDIAVLELANKIPLDDPHRKKATLPEPFIDSNSELHINTKAIITGYGAHDVTVSYLENNAIILFGKLTGDLRYMTTRVMSQDECSMSWPYGIVYFTKSMCARQEKTEKITPKSACRGDSGGPLVLKKGKKNILIGVLSCGPGDCNEQTIPSMYTRVSYYRNFIDCVMAKKSDPEKICEDSIQTYFAVQ